MGTLNKKQSIAKYASIFVDVCAKISDYIATKTIVKDIHKLNPTSFKPKDGMMYRGIAEQGLQDAIETGYFNSPRENCPTTYWAESSNFIVAERASSSIVEIEPSVVVPSEDGIGFSFSGGKWRDGKKVIAEYPDKDDLFQVEYKGKNKEIKDNFRCDELLPISGGKIYIQHWLQGYKEVNLS